ncbi:MAG: family 2 glycosyl transferase [Methanosphaera sp.]|uniref:glycosyltransferase family A protein n=1 Tax=Methanosphaera sp. ISO3-F5 TaxID=1452353 RepID=UPI002B25DD91|nr:glycosyltransferase [Methanosphaera sp. ISO3-F5]MBR0471554.1 family 2 glycosyl transferase [Methanosphaera sp.]WQH64978.1 glycosyltransferase [Methanosphaera sp. ISO3-F5]
MMSIICVYNDEEILNEYLLNSLNAQTEKYELVLVDNRSNEFSSASSALNYGASKAHGEYFVFVHQDINFTDNNWIKHTITQLKDLKNVGIVGVAGKTTDSLVRSNIKQGLTPVDVSPFKIDAVEKASTLDECLFIIPRDVFNRFPLNEECDDWHLYAVDYVYNIKNKGLNAYIIPTMLEHRSKGASMSDGYYNTLPKLQKKYFKRGLIRTCMGDWFTFIPISIQRIIKRFKNY